MLGLSVIISDVWLGYTNYMFRVLWLVDFSEPLNLLLAPAAYLYIRSGVTMHAAKRTWLHFMPAAIYLLYMCLLVYPQSIAYKYNANIGSFHPEMSEIDAPPYGSTWMFFPKWHINDLTFMSMVAYNIAGYLFLRTAFKEKRCRFLHKREISSWLVP